MGKELERKQLFFRFFQCNTTRFISTYLIVVVCARTLPVSVGYFGVSLPVISDYVSYIKKIQILKVIETEAFGD